MSTGLSGKMIGISSIFAKTRGEMDTSMLPVCPLQELMGMGLFSKT